MLPSLLLNFHKALLLWCVLHSFETQIDVAKTAPVLHLIDFKQHYKMHAPF